MKNSKWFLVILVILVGLSCGKNKIEIEDIEDPETGDMLSYNIPDDFDWEMSSQYDFSLRGGAFGVVKVTSADESIVYYKGSYIEDESGAFKFSLKIPDYIKEIRINSELVSIGDGGPVDFLFSIKAAIANYKLAFVGTGSVNFGTLPLYGESAFTIEGLATQTDHTATEYIFRNYANANDKIGLYSYANDLVVEFDNTIGTWAGYSGGIGSGVKFHWAVVYNASGIGDAGRLKLYIDGVEQTLNFSGLAVRSDYTSPNLSSAYFELSSSVNYFNGSMDEIRVWNIARNVGDILTNIDNVIDPTTSGLIAYYRMDDGTGNTVEDITNTYDGSFSVGVAWVPEDYGWDSDGDGLNDVWDDYPLDPDRCYDNYWPAASAGTLAFEDLWPAYGDFDFNDLIVGYQFKTVTSRTNHIVEVIAYMEIRANGSWMTNGNGFGFRLGPDAPDALRTKLEVRGYSHTTGNISIDITGQENGQNRPTIIVIDDVNAVMDFYVNTLGPPSGVTAPPVMIAVTMTPHGASYGIPFGVNAFDLINWDPFIFVNQVRGHEIHKIDFPPTDLGLDTHYQTSNDNSDASALPTPRYYRSTNNLPWVLDIPGVFDYPEEQKNLHWAYHHFSDWASGDNTYEPWYGTTASGYDVNTWRNSAMIYAP